MRSVQVKVVPAKHFCINVQIRRRVSHTRFTFIEGIAGTFVDYDLRRWTSSESTSVNITAPCGT